MTRAAPLAPALLLAVRPGSWRRWQWIAAAIGVALVIQGWREGFLLGN